VIEVEALVGEPPRVAELIEAVSRAAASALGTDVRHCFTTFREIAPGSYFEGGRVRGRGDALEASPLVTVRAFRGRTLEQKAACLRAVARAVGATLGSDPDNVFVEYREILEGHVFTGGEVR
jgi:phenylpyruvate tautomerase PptA (4-oxalocrotonate tautomerase family)